MQLWRFVSPKLKYQTSHFGFSLVDATHTTRTSWWRMKYLGLDSNWIKWNPHVQIFKFSTLRWINLFNVLTLKLFLCDISYLVCQFLLSSSLAEARTSNLSTCPQKTHTAECFQYIFENKPPLPEYLLMLLIMDGSNSHQKAADFSIFSYRPLVMDKASVGT